MSIEMYDKPKRTLSPAFTQRGRTQTYTQKVAAAMNWWRRNMLGLKANINFHSGFFITSAPDYYKMSHARKEVLRQLENQKTVATLEINKLIGLIETFQSLPLTLEDEMNNKSPKKRRKKEPEWDMPF
jgi:hypothetical protein